MSIPFRPLLVFWDDRAENVAALSSAVRAFAPADRDWQIVIVERFAPDDFVEWIGTDGVETMGRPLILSVDGSIPDEPPESRCSIWRQALPKALSRFGLFFDCLSLHSRFFRAGENQRDADLRDHARGLACSAFREAVMAFRQAHPHGRRDPCLDIIWEGEPFDRQRTSLPTEFATWRGTGPAQSFGLWANYVAGIQETDQYATTTSGKRKDNREAHADDQDGSFGA